MTRMKVDLSSITFRNTSNVHAVSARNCDISPDTSSVPCVCFIFVVISYSKLVGCLFLS
jgi:hypothetical protein